VLIVIEHEGDPDEVDLQIEDPNACVSDLVAVAEHGAAAGVGVAIDGRFFAPDTGLDEVGFYEGAVVRLTTAAAAPPHAGMPEGPTLAIIGGPAAGPIHSLGQGELVVGRGGDCDVAIPDLAMSRHHARLHRQNDGTTLVTDLASRNGTWVDGARVRQEMVVPPGALLEFGATQARVLDGLPSDRPIAIDPWKRASGGLVPFNRPPRLGLPEDPSSVAAPTQPAQRSGVGAFSVISILGPVVMGLVLIKVYGDPRFALFMLLSPVMGVLNWLGSKRRASKEHRVTSREFQKALSAFDDALATAAASEMARREILLPDIAETLRRAELPSTQLWQRRPHHKDFLRFRAGIGDFPWSPPVTEDRAGLAPEVRDVIARYRQLPQAPIEADLSNGGVVGLVGEREAALALARSLVCQAAVHHGPTDVGMVVLASEAHRGDWEWAKWLPHVRDATGSGRFLAGDRQTADALLASMMEAAGPDQLGAGLRSVKEESRRGRTRLFVIDDISLTHGRRAPARLLLSGHAGPATGIVIAETEDQLPAVCTTVVQARTVVGDLDLKRPQERVQVDNFLICGASQATARRCALALARYEDPELEVVGAGLPPMVRLLPLLGMDDVEADDVLRTWREAGPDPAPNTPIGMGQDGVVHLDLRHDGPHGLVGGTTGSGKSELLRSMVAGMAARVDPDHLCFVLIDFKGGSAFDHCAQLPHTVGMVTDLDEHLGERALKSLKAELTHRETVLREAGGATQLSEYLAAGSPFGPLPRLVVVIDEFATLATELPDFVTALIGIAQRGRTLGVHLILATQRPSGVVNANIKANTNLRIALRVQDPGDSTDILGDGHPEAAAVSRNSPGRAYVRLGPTEVVILQTALSTAAPGERHSTGVRLTPFCFGPSVATRPNDDHSAGPTDLARLVTAAQEAFARSAMRPPRQPWLPMLPERIDLEPILREAEAGKVVPFALADDPERQRQVPVGWNPADGHLALFGMAGSGTTTTMVAVARALAERYSPDECHLYALDFGSGGLAQLSALAHVGAVITASEREAQIRLVRHLRSELDRRRALRGPERASEAMIVMLVDGVSAFLAEHADAEEITDAFNRVFAEGPGVGITFVLSADRPGALPSRLGSLVSQKIVFRLADPSEFSAIGVRIRDLPVFVPGRAIHGESRLVLQIGHPGDDLTAQTAGTGRQTRPQPKRPPVPIGTLPTTLAFADLPGEAKLEPFVELPVGISDDSLGPAILTLGPGDHALVAGPPRSGKSSTLALIAALIRAADPATVLVGICDDRSPLHPLEALDAAGTLAELAHIVRAAPTDGRRWFLLVDDAPRVQDVGGVMNSVLQSRRPDLHVIAAGRSNDLRSYGHWTRTLREGRTGILLQPDLANDGDLLGGIRLPRRLAVPLLTGRGFVVNAGEATLAQIALPPEPR
jgi:DNA segregation ATPase FtsK/SpoIIIE, S-DNA-T family